MRRSLIIGKANVGKTLFCIRFAEYLGLRDLIWFIERPDGRTEQRKLNIKDAERTLSDWEAHRTRCLQSVHLKVPRGKVDRQLLLTDTTGLEDGIHPDEELRTAMAQTLGALVDSVLCLHVVDAHAVALAASMDGGQRKRSYSPGFDEQLAEYGMTREGYFIIANKTDLPGAAEGYKMLCKRYSKQKVIPVSALKRTGFREVKRHVWRMA